MTNEQIISDFLRTAYTDQRLAELYAHIEDGKFSFVSCCCLRGAATADHALRSRMTAHEAVREPHYYGAGVLPNAHYAENALRELLDDELTDESARKIMLPLVRAEIERRERERSSSESQSPQVVSV